MNYDTNILEYFGLNKNDIRVYSKLLSLGRSKTGAIIKSTNIASSRVYSSLRNLVLKGLVSYQVKNNIKYYQAELPEQLIYEVEEKTLKLKDLYKSLENMPIANNVRNETNTFEGTRGFKMAYERHIANMRPRETLSIITLVGPEYKDSREIRNFFSNVVDKVMIEKKCKAKMITNKTVQRIIQNERPDSTIYDIKYLSAKYMLPYTLNFSSSEIMISVWGETPVIYTISNPIVVIAFQKHFDYLWNIAK
jgi:sugar-specific transcriptional regulator TrmB